MMDDESLDSSNTPKGKNKKGKNKMGSSAMPLVRTIDGAPAESSDPMPSPSTLPPPAPARLEVPGSGATLSNPGLPLPELEVPPLRIVVLLSGTQGDTMPFVQLAHMMRERYGHVVRIATHDDLRAPVEKAGIRFYPMKGNARQMAGWGPSFSLHIPTLLKIALDVQKTSTQLTVIRQIILATVKACTEADPEDQNCEPFHADCIMANPMSIGHIHCAEALGIPLHLFFPNPWVATEVREHAKQESAERNAAHAFPPANMCRFFARTGLPALLLRLGLPLTPKPERLKRI